MIKAMWALGLGVLLLTLAACINRVTSANYQKIEQGMARDQVVEILGEPDEISSMSLAELSGATATWRGGENMITVVFANRQVMFKSFGDIPPRKQ